jgi:3-hydroxyisobutyrate dehydrogenase-like beta-hydroxyacid dehydrogenase
MRVGFIGFDQIGREAASRLLEAGHQLTVYDPLREIPETLVSAGAIAAKSIPDVCHSAEAVITMLPNDEAAEAVILGTGGVVETLPRSAIHIGSSTVSVECADAIAEAHWNAGRQYISAPVLVGSGLAADAPLIVIAGGREATILQIEPLLSPIGQLAQLGGWPSNANLIHLGAMCDDSTLSQLLARYPELCARQDASQLARRAPPFSHSLDIENKGVLQ